MGSARGGPWAAGGLGCRAGPAEAVSQQTGARGPSGGRPAPIEPSPQGLWLAEPGSRSLLRGKQTPTRPGSNLRHRGGVWGQCSRLCSPLPAPPARGAGRRGLPAEQLRGRGATPFWAPCEDVQQRWGCSSPLCRSGQALWVTWGLAQDSGEAGPRLGGTQETPLSGPSA